MTGTEPQVAEDQAAGTAFVGATLIDGTGAVPLADSTVIVRGQRITHVGRTADLELMTDLRRVDVTGTYLVPGLLDANVHLVLQIDPEVLLRYEHGCYDELVVESAQVALRAGITTVFDTWGPLESLRRVRDGIVAGEIVGSRIFLAGNIVGNNGPWSANFVPSYGQTLNPAVVDAVNRHWEQGVGGHLAEMASEDVRHVVRDYISGSGIDFVKYGSASHGNRQLIALSPDSQRAIVEEAHAAGLTAQACAGTPETVKLAIEVGVDLLQHVTSSGRYPMAPQTLNLIVSRQLPCVALLYTKRHVAAAPAALRDMLAVKENNDRALIKAHGKVMQATDGGVLGPTASTSPWLGPRAADPDLPWHLGHSHLLWLKAAVELGMTPMDALLATTRNIAEAYGKGDELGTIEPGKRADLLLLEANPLDDPENYGHIANVVKDGVLIDRDRLPERRILTKPG